MPGFAARCFTLGSSILRDLALHEACRDQILKKCADGATGANADAAPLTATFRFGKEDKANAEAKLKKVRNSRMEKRMWGSSFFFQFLFFLLRISFPEYTLNICDTHWRAVLRGVALVHAVTRSRTYPCTFSSFFLLLFLPS